MKPGTRERYSLRMMVEIARQSDADCPINLQDVSMLTGISRGYLEQLAMGLRKAKLLSGRPGRNGGQYLAREPNEIRVRDVFEAATGTVELVRCVDDPSACARSPHCHCRMLWTLLTLRIRRVLDDYTLADLADPEWLRAAVEEERRQVEAGRSAAPARRRSKARKPIKEDR